MPLKMTSLPSAERVRELLNYDPETGIFTWKVTRSRSAKAGGVAGYSDHAGYICICLDGTLYRAHRLAWLYTHNEDPGDLQINHIDSRSSNNAIVNLELVTNRENSQHTASFGGKQNGLPLGVYWSKKSQNYRAQIQIAGKRYNLGGYNTPERASAVYVAASQAAETIMCGQNQVPLLLANVVRVETGVNLTFHALRDLPAGVHCRNGRFAAQITYGGKSQHLGTFNTPEEASAAYQEAKARLAP